MSDKKKYSILVIDDEATNILTLIGILGQQYTIYAQKSGSEGIAAAEQLKPDLILLDILMPDMDGYEVLAALRAAEKTKDIPVIFITGLRDADDEKKGLSLGAADYITKPFTPEVVELRIKNQLSFLSQRMTEYDLMKYRLTSQALNIALWDMEVIAGDPINPANKFSWSQEFRHMLGFDDENDFPDLLHSWSDRLHSEDKKRTLAAFAAHINDPSGQTPYDLEYRLMLKNGNYRYFHAFGTTLRDKEGVPLRVAGALMDITEKKEAEEAARKVKIAEESDKAKSRFLANMSHEIRTPMNAILGVTEILLQDETVPPKIAEALERIYVSSDLLMGIINDILDFSKIEAGKLDIIPAPYQIASLIHDSANLNMLRIGGKPIEFSLRIDENIPTRLIGDELRIKQILNNVLSNAFKYTDAGEVVLTVTVRRREGVEGVELVMSIKDSGRGMSPEQVARLFEEYSRFGTESGRQVEGTGLGLAITQSLLNLMDGQIEVESEAGKGSLFTVCLPQGVADGEVLGRELAENLQNFHTSLMTSKKRGIVEHEPMPYGRVLVVDDVETNLFVARGLMKPYGLAIETALSGRESIEKLKNGAVYDIIFMDHMMPEMSGIETVEQIRAMGYTEPIVALTADAVAGQADMFLSNGFDAFISKPIDIRRLATVLNTLIRDKQPPEVLAAARSQAQTAAVTAPDDYEEGLLAGKKIDGFDIVKGINRYGGDEEAFVGVLRKFAAGTRSLLATLESVSAEGLPAYKISVHGIKGACSEVFAAELGEKAKALEEAAKAGDIAYINEHNAPFLAAAWQLIGDLETALADVDQSSQKPQRERPDDAALARLTSACAVYSMDGVDASMAEIEAYSYTADDGLARWLREKVDMMDFDEIVVRVSVLIQ